MKKNRLYAAMAAVVLLAAGCTDEIDNNTNGTEDPEGNNGDKVYMTVNISTSGTGSMTKATGDDSNAPLGGEDGNGDLEGEEFEQKVHDVNFYLLPVSESFEEGDDLLNLINNNTNIDFTDQKYLTEDRNEIEAAESGSLEHHLAKATVQFDIENPTNKTFYILTIANLGEEKKFKSLFQLRDYLETGAWTNSSGNYSKFIMSTHQMTQNNLNSKITITSANLNPSTPAEATVFLERLAARIDLKLSNGLSADGGVVVGTTEDKFKITGYSIVNQLKAGTYMLKRVSEDVDDASTELTSEATTDLYLKNENYSLPNKYNYVIDPWTRGKVTEGKFPDNINMASHYANGNEAATAASQTGIADLYINHFDNGLNTNSSFTAVEENSFADFTRIAYTRENTTKLNEQKNGFSTGVIFKGIYTPKNISVYNETSGDVDLGTVGDEGDFYLVNGVYCTNLKTAGVLAFKTAESVSVDIIKAIFAESNPDWSKVQSGDFSTAITHMTGGKLGAAFKSYLLGEYDKIKDNWDGAGKNSLSWNEFVQTELGNQDAAGLFTKYDIAFYDGGTCYYKFWIRHASNGDPNTMGVMEFAIVRNNVYQLDVTGVSKLGDPLPFTPGIDDPNNPDESNKVYINVDIYVKNWVKRSNADIIL